MPPKLDFSLQNLSAIAQIISLPFTILAVWLIVRPDLMKKLRIGKGIPEGVLIAVLSWLMVRPDLLKELHIGREAPAAALIALLVWFAILTFVKPFVTKQKQVRAWQYQRQAHDQAQRKLVEDMDALKIGEDRRELTMDNFVEPWLQRVGRTGEQMTVSEAWSSLGVLREAVCENLAGVVIWGMAGAGKTMLAKWLTYQLATPEVRETWPFLQRQAADDLAHCGNEQRPILDWRGLGLRWLGLESSEYVYPYEFYIKLKSSDFENETAGNAEVILKCFQSREEPALASEVRKWADNKLILPIFDGLDDLTSTARNIFLSSLQEFAEHPRGGMPFILTSRQPLSDSDMTKLGNHVVQWQLLPFNSGQVEDYIERFPEHGSEPQARHAKELWDVIYDTAQTAPRFWQLLTEPLLLSMIVFAFDLSKKKSIATDRTAIYETYLEKMISRKRDQHDHTGDQQTNIAAADLQKTKSSLGEVAYRGIQDRRTIFSIAELTPDERRAFDEFEGILTWTDSSMSSCTFSHATLQSFFAAVHLTAQLRKNGRTDTGDSLWQETVKQSVAQADILRAEGKGDNEVWRAYWRDVLVMTAGMLLSRGGVTRDLEASGVYRATLWVRDEIRTPQGRVLFLRLLAAIKERVGSLPPNTIGQASVVPWLNDLLKSVTSAADMGGWQRDLGEIGEMLPDDDWDKLQRQVGASETSDQILRLLGALRHGQSARIIIDIALNQQRISQEIEGTLYQGHLSPEVEAVLRHGCVSPQIRDALRLLGALAIAPLVERYNTIMGEYQDANYSSTELGMRPKHGRDEWIAMPQIATGDRAIMLDKKKDALRRLGLLIEMMGYVGYAKELKSILNLSAPGEQAPDELVPVANMALARWGGRSALVLLERLEKTSGSSEIKRLQRKSLVLALAEAPIEGELAAKYREYLGQDRDEQQRQIVVEVIQEKLRLSISNNDSASQSDRRAVEQIFGNDLATYKCISNSRWRHILRWLETHGGRRTALYSSLRGLSTLSPAMLRSMLQISAGVDCDFSRQWILSALKDPCLEIQGEDKKAFVALSMQHPTDPYQWWEQICCGLPREVNEGLKERLDQEVQRVKK